MGIAGFFLLLGLLLSEVALFGVAAAGVAGAALLVVAAGLLARCWAATRPPAPAAQPRTSPLYARSGVVGTPKRA
jgi:hypothetical protein